MIISNSAFKKKLLLQQLSNFQKVNNLVLISKVFLNNIFSSTDSTGRSCSVRE